ncbi:MAG: hypothetical protein FWG01_00915 [Betaproteobacteria bacterium]|nr:hypothetical protein [Betaproteobacteria bacterium]
MSKDGIILIEAGCRIAGYISETAKKNHTTEVFDVLEVTTDGQFRCHMIGTRFDQVNRHIFLHEHQLIWCRLLNGQEFVRKTPEDRWLDTKQLSL